MAHMKLLTKIIAIALVLLTIPLRAEDANAITHNQSHQDNYSWELSDQDQKKQAAGILAWGIFFTIAIAVVSCLVPNSPSASPTSSGGSGADPVVF